MYSNIETNDEHPKIKLSGTIQMDSFGNYNIKKNKSTQTKSKFNVKLRKCKKNIFTCCLKTFSKDTFRNKI